MRRGFQAAAKQIYAGRATQSPEGEFMFYCSDKKAAWYLQRGLGKHLIDQLLLSLTSRNHNDA